MIIWRSACVEFACVRGQFIRGQYLRIAIFHLEFQRQATILGILLYF